ncbi:MAG: hypothetical protein LBE25_10370 [Arthrobacter sp.]|jgi:hypothetical protein|nr:hypothetical protein [Arthrobacter sp.]
MSTPSDYLRVPLTAFLRGEVFPPFEADTVPVHAWGLFEAIDADGSLTWAERMTEGAEVESVFAQLSGYLGDLARHDVWLEDDEDFAPLPEGDLPEEEEQLELDERFEALRFIDLDPGLRLTGRYLFLLLMDRDPGTDSNAVLFDRGLNGYEVEGLLRVAQLRFTETLSWSDPEPETIVPSAPPARGTFGEIFAGWSFPALERGVRLTSAWAVTQIEFPDGTVDWVERRTQPLEDDRLAGLLAWRVAHLEEYSVASWDDPDERPGFPSPFRLDEVEESFEGEEPDYDPTRRDGPLSQRIGRLECLSLEPGMIPVRTFLVALGTDADGDPHSYLAYAARPSWNESLDFFSDFEELGLLRSCLRDLLR